MALDTDKIDEAVLALLYLTRHDHWRAWKGFDWDALDRLYEKGLRRPIRPRPRRRGSPRVGLASRREQAAPAGQRLARVGVRWTAPAAAVHAATGTKGSE